MPDRKQQCSRVCAEQTRNAGRWPARLRIRVPAMAVLALCGLLATACDRGSRPGRIGSTAPEFTVSDGTRTVDLAKLRGHVVVLNFWATYCIPCIEEVPSLGEMQRRLPQVAVIAISGDEDDAAYRQFLTDNHLNFLTVRDGSGRIPRMYGTVKIPETYVIDRRGLVRRKFVSAQDWTSPEILDYLGKL